MLLIKASVKHSPIHGFGCFADEAIKKGDVVWVFDDRIDIRLPVSALETLPPAAQAFWRKYGYAEIHQGQKTVVLCGDHSKHMNHALTPNLGESGEHGEVNIALRDIAAGEELTCNYYNFDLNVHEKLDEDNPI